MKELKNCIECLRLLCENHNSDLQQYLRNQFDGGDPFRIRPNSVNFIQIVTEMMHLYINNVSAINISLGNKMFELLIEML